MESDLNHFSRRSFLTRTMATTGAGLILGAPSILSAQTTTPSDAIHVALIGFGKQGEVLFNCLKNIPGLHFQAVCDISAYNQKRGIAQVNAHQGSKPKGYMDIDELLSTEKGLDAAIVATPDFWHSPHTVKCLEAGLHVYCEKMMSNTIDGARAMVKAMEKSGKLCQIGHQRRSNPRYRFTLEQLIQKKKICGQITSANAQWNRSLGASQDIGGSKLAKSIIVPDEVLTRYGFKNMHQFLNWRFYRDLSGGPISDLGAHQIDIFNWFFGCQPKSVFASGGNDYFKQREHYDNVMAIFEYETAHGSARAFYQVLTTTSSGGGFWENFMGTEASIKISEISSSSVIYREAGAPEWESLVAQGYLKKKSAPEPSASSGAGAVKSYASAAPEAFELPGDLPVIQLKDGTTTLKPAHQPHLENFFAAILGKTKLNCDARHAFESEAPIFAVNDSARAHQPIVFTPEQLSV